MSIFKQDGSLDGETQGRTMMAKINKLMVGESLVGDGNEVAHIDLIMGPARQCRRARVRQCADQQ